MSKEKVIVIDSGNLMHRAIFAFMNNPQIPPTYTYLRMVIANLKQVETQLDDLVILACDYGRSWRKGLDHCLPEDTEVLTVEGWKLLKEIVENKLKIKIATLNPKTNKVEYCKPIDYIKYYHKGKMYKFGGDSSRARFDILMTPKHQQYFANKETRKFALSEAENLPTYPIIFKRDFNYQSNKKLIDFYLPKYRTENSYYRQNNIKITTICEYPERKINGNYWIKLLGWYIAEGCVGGRKKRKVIEKIVISQSNKHNPKNVKEIRKILNKLNISFCEQIRKNEIISFSILDTQLATYLSQFGKSKEKFIPRDLIDKLSKRQCKLLLKSLLKGDGTKRGFNSYSYTTVSNQLADDIQELALKAGFVATKSKWYYSSNSKFRFVYITKTDSSETRKKVIENWAGTTYDIIIKNHIFFIRRNGKCLWTGNCYKAQRKAVREERQTPEWWTKQYRSFDTLFEQLDKAVNWQRIAIWGMEADDIASVASRYYKDREVILISSDKDWEMIAIFENVKVFSPISKKFKEIKNPMGVLMEKIQGDISDNLKEKPSNEKEFEIRKQIVDLTQLPEEIERPIKEALDKMLPKNLYIHKLPFRSIGIEMKKLYKIGE